MAKKFIRFNYKEYSFKRCKQVEEEIKEAEKRLASLREKRGNDIKKAIIKITTSIDYLSKQWWVYKNVNYKTLPTCKMLDLTYSRDLRDNEGV